MFSIDGMSPVVVQEKIEFDPRFRSMNFGIKYLFDNNPNKKVTLLRNIFNDTFNITVPDFKMRKTKWFTGRATLAGMDNGGIKIIANYNNKETSRGLVEKMVNHPGDGKEKVPEETYFVHTALFKGGKLRDAKEVTVVEENYAKGYLASARFTMFPKFGIINKNVSIKEKEYIEYKTINAVSFKLSSKGIRDGSSELTLKHGITEEISYSHTYIVPRPISRISHNKVLYDIYISNDVNHDIYKEGETKFDYSLKEGKILSSALPKQMQLSPIKVKGIQTKWNESEHKGSQTQPKYVGSFEIRDFSGYDYEKQKGTMGLVSNSKQGELIPYNYEGSYSRTTTLGINDIYKKINIIQSLGKTQPILQPDAGRFMLNIYQNELPSNPTWKTIDQKLFKKDAKYIYPLLGLERLAKLTEGEKNEKAI